MKCYKIIISKKSVKLTLTYRNDQKTVLTDINVQKIPNVLNLFVHKPPKKTCKKKSNK